MFELKYEVEGVISNFMCHFTGLPRLKIISRCIYEGIYVEIRI